MSVLVGIDEAGFGPILGPLVVSSTAFSLPADLLEADLWHILKKSTAQKRKHLAGRLLIADSKKAYSKSIGIKHLQRTVLAMLNCLGCKPASLTGLVEVLCPESLPRLSCYPWYEKTESYLLSYDQTDIDIASNVLNDDLASNNIKLLDIASACLDVAYYNKMVNSVKNKSTVLFTATCQLIQKALENFPDSDLQIIIDRQGGRVKYRKVLQRMFPDMQLKILRQSSAFSSYHLSSKDSCPRYKNMKLHFVVAADDKFLPVSLASMVSKFLRELLVDNINRYFTSLHSGLKPTAGYWKDGTRFIKELKNRPAKIEFDSNLLVRSR